MGKRLELKDLDLPGLADISTYDNLIVYDPQTDEILWGGPLTQSGHLVLEFDPTTGRMVLKDKTGDDDENNHAGH